MNMKSIEQKLIKCEQFTFCPFIFPTTVADNHDKTKMVIWFYHDFVLKQKEFLKKVKQFILNRGDLELKMAQIEKKLENFAFVRI